MPAKLIIPENSLLYQSLASLVTQKRMLFIAGLPGVGKSLILQQSTLMAHQVGRRIHLLQWDVARLAFETPALMAKYPEVEGVTHPAIRKAVGLWARQAVQQWHQRFQADEHLLLGELPLVGNRLIELAQRADDPVESLLADAATHFIIPVPSEAVRTEIEQARQRSTARPQHEREKGDAPPHVLNALWQELVQIAQQLSLVDPPKRKHDHYQPETYASVYQHVLQHRHHSRLDIDLHLPNTGSVYDLDLPDAELTAGPAEVEEIVAWVEATYHESELNRLVCNWYLVDN